MADSNGNPEVNDIDLLMSLDPLDMTKLDVDKVIAYHRNQRVAKEAGGKRSKATKDTGPTQKLDLVALGLKPATPKINRRI